VGATWKRPSFKGQAREADTAEVAVDLAVRRPRPAGQPALLQRAAALPAWVWLTGLVAASFGGRLLAAASRVVPYYLPDEYIYPSLARGFAQHGRPVIRGVGVHFPALLEPLVTAPVWLVTNDPHTAWRLTQGLHAFVVSLAVVPAYLLARRAGLGHGFAIGVAALAVAIPDTVYASSMLADAVAYPLALAALCAGMYVITSPTARAQTAFVVFSALAVFTRLEYAAIPLAVVAGALAADRGRVFLTLKRLWPSVIALGAPPALAFAILGQHRVLGPYSHARHGFAPVAIAQWVARDAMLLVYSSGWVIVPGALVALGYALLRPRTRAEIGFAVTTLVLAGALLVEAAQIADTDSRRFQERYVFVLVPLLATAFGVYCSRGFPRKLVVAAISTGLLLLAARIPLSGYAAAHGKDDSPTLWAVLRLEAAVTTGNGALAVAIVAALLSGVAVFVAWRRTGGLVAVGVAVAACCSLSAGAASFDGKISHELRHSLPADVRWIDHANVGNVDVIAPPGARREQTWEALFWNLSARRLYLFGSPAIDQFAVRHLRVAGDGRLVGIHRAFGVQTYASTLQLTGVRRVRHELIWDLYRPAGTPRLQLLAAGRYVDGWLAARGAFTVWTRRGGVLALDLFAPRTLRTTTMHFGTRTVRVRPGQHMSLNFAVPAHRWSLHFWTPRPAYLADRSVSVIATSVRFVPAK
jgi:hypothetical protein